MSTELITGRVWARLNGARRKSRQRALVAVAYSGKGAARLLNLNSGSLLVVDASENAVKSGQTCPADLLALLDRGVRIFSYPGLHAKVYVFGKTAAVGSANASQRSADKLLEAIVMTTDARTVKRAKTFIESIAKDELGPKVLKELSKLYRPPRLPPEPRQPKPASPTMLSASSLPRIRVVQLSRVTWSERDEAEHDAGEQMARRQRKRRRSWGVDDFQWIGARSFRKGDKVLMVTREVSGERFVDAPATVLHVRSYSYRNGAAAFVYVELPLARRRNLKVVAKALGRGWLRRLRRGGVLSHRMSEKLYGLWQA